MVMLTRVDVAGEFVRKDITNRQVGVSLFVDTGIIDANTCEPVPDIFC